MLWMFGGTIAERFGKDNTHIVQKQSMILWSLQDPVFSIIAKSTDLQAVDLSP